MRCQRVWLQLRGTSFESLEGLEVWNGLSEFKGWPVFGEWSPELVFKVLGCWDHWKHERHHTDEVAARRLLLAKLTEEGVNEAACW